MLVECIWVITWFVSDKSIELIWLICILEMRRIPGHYEILWSARLHQEVFQSIFQLLVFHTLEMVGTDNPLANTIQYQIIMPKPFIYWRFRCRVFPMSSKIFALFIWHFHNSFLSFRSAIFLMYFILQYLIGFWSQPGPSQHLNLYDWYDDNLEFIWKLSQHIELQWTPDSRLRNTLLW